MCSSDLMLPASISTSCRLRSGVLAWRMKSTSRIELRTMMPASAMKPIMEVAVNGASLQPSQPFAVSRRRMFHFIPKSYAATRKRVLPLSQDAKPRPLLRTRFNEYQPRLSPDGRWLAYVSDESGRDEVYVRPFPEVDKGKWQVSTSGGVYPLWSPDGRELAHDRAP